MVEYCDCTRPNDIGRNNPCFDCAKPIEICNEPYTGYCERCEHECIKKRGHDGNHLSEIEWK